MDTPNLTLTFAFLAGLVSFASPCVLPLVPAYLGYLGGTSVLAGERESSRRETARTFFHAPLFCAWLWSGVHSAGRDGHSDRADPL